MTRAILVNFHLYTPFGKEFYNPILDFFLVSMKRYEDEYDHLYLLDSNWGIEPKKIQNMKASIIRTNPNMRYYDCFKEILPQIKEDLVLFMDNDVIVYKPYKIVGAFSPLIYLKDKPDVVSIYDTIGTYQTDKLNGKNKFCPYWFSTKKELLMKYLDIDWGDHMPHSETFGLLTEAMLNDGIRSYEWPEDKNSIYFDGIQDEESSKNTGVYHIRSGSVPAVLLAWKENQPEQYWKYLKEQPKNEYLRQMLWFDYMLEQTGNSRVRDDLFGILEDLKIGSEWFDYRIKFREYHGL